MARTRDFLAIDLGASSGRVLAGRWDGARFDLAEVHRFANEPVSQMGRLHWDALAIWSEIKRGLARYAAGQRVGTSIGGGAAERPGELAGLGLDTWGVDFALLDRAGNLLGNPYHYRDRRTAGIMALAFERVPRRDVFMTTGVQPMHYNTLYQLLAMVLAKDPQLDAAATMLTMPNLFAYWLCGQPVAERTHATTTQCLDAHTGGWAIGLLEALLIPTRILPPLVEPGTLLDSTSAEMSAETGLSPTPVFAVACHDTASAVAAIPGLDTESAYISSGTWSLMGVEIPSPVITDAVLAAGFTNEGGVAGTTRLLRNIPGLWLVAECRRRWQRDGQDYGWDELVAMAERSPGLRSLIDPDDPSLLNPPDMPAAIRTLCRATSQEPPESVGAVARCCLDSLALRCRATLDELALVTGRRPRTLRVVGGGSQNRLLCQLIADACGLPLVAGPAEATAFGNLLVQAMAAGELSGLADGRAAVAASITLDTYEPQSGAAWDAALSRLRDLAAYTPD
ncbi:MAG: rhamnulokinase family protein [Candidatus Limnocylindrales bacterium]